MQPIDKRQWFDVPDSLCEREDGKGAYYNVQARFSDHPVYNAEKSKVVRHNVYDVGILLHTKVLRAGGDAPAIKNMSGLTMRFDLGETQDEENFRASKAAITRCWDAWQHYQKFREAPVTEAELLCLKQINASPERPKGVLIDMGGELVRKEFDVDAEVDDEQVEEEERVSRQRLAPKKKTRKVA